MRCAGEDHEAQFACLDDALAVMHMQAGHGGPLRESLFTDRCHLVVRHVTVRGVLDRHDALAIDHIRAYLAQEDLMPTDVGARSVLSDALRNERCRDGTFHEDVALSVGLISVHHNDQRHPRSISSSCEWRQQSDLLAAC